MIKRKIAVGVLMIAGACGVTAIAAGSGWLSTLGLGPERAVRARAAGYWNARMTGDLKALAPYVHPLQKSLQENNVLATDSFEITGVKVNGDEATVGVKAKYEVKLGQTSRLGREMAMEDHWVRYKGQWYHALHPTGFGEILRQGLGKWKPPAEPQSQP